MVDLISSRTIDVTKLALDGLMMRQKAITANTANVMTPGYQRKEVSFEGQLHEIIQKDDLKEYIKGQNSIQYNPTSLDMVTATNEAIPKLTPQQAKYLQSDIYGNYSPQVKDDYYSASDMNGNNVELEKEVMDMANVGLRYSVLSGLEQKQLQNVGAVIKGEVS